MGITRSRLTALTGAQTGDPRMVDMNRIWQIESSGQPNAVSPDGGAFGLGQVRRPALLDWNSQHPKQQFSTSDLLDPNVNAQVSSWHMNTNIPRQLNAIGVPDTEINRVAAYRVGAGNVKKGIVPTSYIQKYQELGNDDNNQVYQ